MHRWIGQQWHPAMEKARERLVGQPRLFGAVNQVVKERMAKMAVGLEHLYMCKWRAKVGKFWETR